MMTFILIASFCLIVFVGLLRYDIHKHKYANEKNKRDTSSGSDSSTDSSGKSNNHHETHSDDSSSDGGD